MKTIDADAHVIETMATWQYMKDSERRWRPIEVNAEDGDQRPGTQRMQTGSWAIDGRLRPRERNIGDETPREAREMTDIARRVSHMSELDIDVQVLYPSLFLRPLTRTKEIELALARSYNAWLIDIWKKGGGRLRWVAVPPVQSLGDPGLVRAELTHAKANGACGIFINGFCFDRELWDPYFFPLYEIATELSLPICVHTGNNSIVQHDFFLEDTSFNKFIQPAVSAFHTLIEKEIPKQFPKIKWSFVEAGAQWVPYVWQHLRRGLLRSRGQRMTKSFMAENNFYVAVDPNEDVPYIMSYTGEDHLVVGTDYGHHDAISNMNALVQLANRDDLSASAKAKINGDNARKLYDL